MCVTGSTTQPGAGSVTVATMTAETTLPPTIAAAASAGQRALRRSDRITTPAARSMATTKYSTGAIPLCG